MGLLPFIGLRVQFLKVNFSVRYRTPVMDPIKIRSLFFGIVAKLKAFLRFSGIMVLILVCFGAYCLNNPSTTSIPIDSLSVPTRPLRVHYRPLPHVVL